MKIAVDESYGRAPALRLTFVLSLVVFVLLAGLDVITTAVMLTHGITEGNPLIHALIAHSGVAAFAAVKLTSSATEIGIFALTFLLLPGRWRWLSVAMIIASDAWLFVVVGHNVLLALSAAGLPV